VFTAAGSSYESEVWGDLDYIRNSLGRSGAVSLARVRLNSPSDFDAYRDAIENDKRFSMKVMRESDYFEKQSQGTKGFLVFSGGHDGDPVRARGDAETWVLRVLQVRYPTDESIAHELRRLACGHDAQ
jgi:hypothetical protein